LEEKMKDKGAWYLAWSCFESILIFSASGTNTVSNYRGIVAENRRQVQVERSESFRHRHLEIRRYDLREARAIIFNRLYNTLISIA
jgi:hypothetical protein